MKPDQCAIILVEPQGPINVGSVCRAMMNFGFSDLRLVNPCRDYQSEFARKMALEAQSVLNNARLHPTLESALADCQVAFGTTRRFGKYRTDFMTPDTAGTAMAELDDKTRCAMVFGREDNGLHTSELDLCQHFVTIPTHADFPSMNLSHSLAVCLYEISMALFKKNSGPKNRRAGADNETLEQMFDHMRRTLLDIDFLDPQNPDHLLRTFRRLFSRAGLSARDVKIIRGLMSRIDWTEDQRKRNAGLLPGNRVLD
ncbi:MAG: RNA methyltransferase [Pseudomonadota bacterium]